MDNKYWIRSNFFNELVVLACGQLSSMILAKTKKGNFFIYVDTDISCKYVKISIQNSSGEIVFEETHTFDKRHNYNSDNMKNVFSICNINTSTSEEYESLVVFKLFRDTTDHYGYYSLPIEFMNNEDGSFSITFNFDRGEEGVFGREPRDYVFNG